jgi:glyoxylase-like metal-dependent hydrolase (beta-lactamase superfamily II)
VHAPPGEWLIVDSLVDSADSSPVGPANSANPAIRLLHEHRAEPAALLLTHPHEDHAAGFDAFIERWTNAKIGYLGERMSSSGDRLTAPDFEQSLRSGLAEHAVSAIRDAWERFPNRKWDLLPGSTIDLGLLSTSCSPILPMAGRAAGFSARGSSPAARSRVSSKMRG